MEGTSVGAIISEETVAEETGPSSLDCWELTAELEAVVDDALESNMLKLEILEGPVDRVDEDAMSAGEP